MIRVDEVEADRLMAHARLAGPGFAGIDVFPAQHFGAAGLMDSDGVGHGYSPWSLLSGTESR